VVWFILGMGVGLLPPRIIARFWAAGVARGVEWLQKDAIAAGVRDGALFTAAALGIVSVILLALGQWPVNP
jgi:hypothetical protein